MKLNAYRLGTSIFTDGCLCGVRSMASAGPFDWCLIGQYSCPRFAGAPGGEVRCEAQVSKATKLAVLAEAFERRGEHQKATQVDALCDRTMAALNPPGFRFWSSRRVLAVNGTGSQELAGCLRVAMQPSAPQRSRTPGRQWNRHRSLMPNQPLGPVPPYKDMVLSPNMGPEEESLKFIAPGRIEDMMTQVFFDLLEEQREREQVAPGDPRKKPLSSPFVKAPFVAPGLPENNDAHRFQVPFMQQYSMVQPREFKPLVQIAATHLLQHDTKVPLLLQSLFEWFPRTATPIIVKNLLDAWGQLRRALKSTPDPKQVPAKPRTLARHQRSINKIAAFAMAQREGG